ncbi:MAG: hypothetical protein JWP01_2332 [Myxococcales bacterium]|nr:hypothetical protein [Myxococcales bacterium]
MLRSRLRALGVAAILAFGLLIGFRQLGTHGAYAGHGAYRAQVDAFLAGRLALTTAPEGLAHDLAWTPTGVQQVWGLGVPMWMTPFEVGARVVGVDPFPDRIAMGLWLALVMFVLIRAFFRARDGEAWWIGAGSVLLTALLPGFLAMLRGRLGVYEEAAIYSYGAALILLGGTVALHRFPSGNRYVVLLLAAGLAGFVRPTVWFYGLGTAVVASWIYLRAHGRRALPIAVLGLAVFGAGGLTLYTTNAQRFGSGTEFGHRLNLQSLSGNIYATRFSYPFQRVSVLDATAELGGAMFDRPEVGAKRGFYNRGLHRGEADVPRWREYYFTTYSWPYLPLLLAAIVIGVRAGYRRRRQRTADPLAPVLLAWAVIGAAPLVVFYLRAPFLSSRYLLDLAPAVAALLVIVWRAGSTWIASRGRGAVAFGILVALWATAIVTSTTRRRIEADPVDGIGAIASAAALSRPATQSRVFPSEYVVDSDWIASQDRPSPHGLYLNGTGWYPRTNRIAPATHFFVEDPQFIEVEVENAPGEKLDLRSEVRATLGLEHLRLATAEPTPAGMRLRFAIPRPPRGLHVVFLAFGPDTRLDRGQSDLVLRRVRWRQ